MACVVHHGSFNSLGNAYCSLLEWVEKYGYQIAGSTREVYLHYEREGDPIFCGRSGQVFEYQLQGGSVNSSVMTLESKQPVQTITAPKRRVVGVGNVGREPGKATYTLYSPYSDRLEFKTVYYGGKKGFGN